MNILLHRHLPLIILIGLVAIAMLMPHPHNVTPVAALGLFSGHYLSGRSVLLVPVITACIADLLGPGFYDLSVMFFVYAGLLLSSLAGRCVIRQDKLWTSLAIAVIVTSVGFYLVSNIGSFIAHYPHTLQGLVDCYTKGLPYLLRTLLGNSLYGLLFFAFYELIRLGQGKHLTLPSR